MKRVIIFLLVGFSFFIQSVTSEGAVLEWDDNTDADYYVVYWSTNAGTLTAENSKIIPGDITYVELEDSPDGQQFHFTVKAFNDCGNSSDYSDTVVSAHIPAEISYGTPIDQKAISAAVVGAQSNGDGCFIGSM